MTFHLMSSSFKQGEYIPPIHTCDGENSSPPLNWKNSPAKTKSFALICDDPDAPAGVWSHWVVYNIPATVSELAAHFPAMDKMADGTEQGKNDFKKIGYGGPCPPKGKHRYFFKLYALDSLLSLPLGANKQQLEAAMKEHIIGKAELMGVYQRS